VTYLYYPGCSLHSTAEEFNDSAQALLKALGFDYEELDDWNCCGATPAHATSEFLTAALPLRNLVNAEKQVEKWAGAPGTGDPAGAAPIEILVPCAACYNAFRLAERLVRDGGAEGREINREIAEITGRPFGGTVTVRHPLELLSRRETLDKLRALVTRPLGGLKVASYYGCLLARPSKIVSFEPNPEHPVAMDNVMAALGAEPVRWARKTDCCGQSMAVAEGELVTELTNRVSRAAKEAGAEAIATACPLCMMNLDTRQKPATPGEPLLPVFFFTELGAVALGVGKPQAWWKRHLTDVRPALELLEAKRSA
jgi:heterodisulfide reductase subunit B